VELEAGVYTHIISFPLNEKGLERTFLLLGVINTVKTTGEKTGSEYCEAVVVGLGLRVVIFSTVRRVYKRGSDQMSESFLVGLGVSWPLLVGLGWSEQRFT
jgi:hypothetical protein